MGGGEGKMAGEEGLTGGVHLPVSQKNKDIGRLVEQTKNNFHIHNCIKKSLSKYFSFPADSLYSLSYILTTSCNYHFNFQRCQFLGVEISIQESTTQLAVLISSIRDFYTTCSIRDKTIV
jgi:hypothetical protein